MSDVGRMQAWAGQSCALAREEPAGEVVRRLWDEGCAVLSEAITSRRTPPGSEPREVVNEDLQAPVHVDCVVVDAAMA
jgi:hypothetical protein